MRSLSAGLLLVACTAAVPPSPVAPTAEAVPKAVVEDRAPSSPPEAIAPPVVELAPTSPTKVEAARTPYPIVHCADGEDADGRWMIRIDPTLAKDQLQAERLADRYPNADGVRGALSRSNIPEQWREIRDVTVITADGAQRTSVRTPGVRLSPSGGAYVFALRAKRPAGATKAVLIVEGHGELSTTPMVALGKPPTVTEARWATLEEPFEEHVRRARPRVGRPSLRARHVRWVEADVGGGLTGFLVATGFRDGAAWSALAATDESDALETVPVHAGGGTSGPAGYAGEAQYTPVALLDLDRDGHAELMLHEDWYEGRYTWIVRFDEERGALVGELICGDAT